MNEGWRDLGDKRPEYVERRLLAAFSGDRYPCVLKAIVSLAMGYAAGMPTEHPDVIGRYLLHLDDQLAEHAVGRHIPLTLALAQDGRDRLERAGIVMFGDQKYHLSLNGLRFYELLEDKDFRIYFGAVWNRRDLPFSLMGITFLDDDEPLKIAGKDGVLPWNPLLGWGEVRSRG